MLRTILIPLSLSAALLSGSALAQTTTTTTTTTPTNCADIKDDAGRLACYDRAARGLTTPPAGTKSTSTGGPIRTSPSAGTGAGSTGTAGTRTTGTGSTGTGTPPSGTTAGGPTRTPPGASTAGSWQMLTEPGANGGENIFLLTYAQGAQPNADKAALTINCENRRLSLYARWPHEAGARLHKVTYTIDGGKPQLIAMAYSTDTYSTGLWHPKGAAYFVNRLAGHQRLTMSLTAKDGTPLAAIFDVGGLDQVIGRLRAACRF